MLDPLITMLSTGTSFTRGTPVKVILRVLFHKTLKKKGKRKKMRMKSKVIKDTARKKMLEMIEMTNKVMMETKRKEMTRTILMGMMGIRLAVIRKTQWGIMKYMCNHLSVSFDVIAQIYGGDDQLFQILQMKGALIVIVGLSYSYQIIVSVLLETKPSSQVHDQCGRCEVEFTQLKFGSMRSTKSTAYEQYHVRVTVDSGDKNAAVDVRKPLRSTALDRGIKETLAGKITRGGTIGAALGGIFGVTTATLTGTATRTSETSSSSERKRFSSKVAEQGMLGVAWWEFNIDDPYEREGGIEMSTKTLPSVEFEFLGESDTLTPPPEHVNIEVASYWSINTSHQEAEQEMINSYLHLEYV